jgi:putative ABC transport system permease protein
MRSTDVLALAAESLRLHRLRTLLTLTAVAVGAVAVLILTSLGEGAKRYVVAQFAALGSNGIAAMPGRTETTGIAPAFGGTRDLTLEDAEDIRRRVPTATDVVPFSLGAARVEWEQRHRDIYVVGVTAGYAPMLDLRVARGRFLPGGDPRRGEPVAVLGPKVARELFGAENPLGQNIRIAGGRFRVVGVLEEKGTALGIDFDDLILVPVSSGLRLFNQSGLNRILIQSRSEESIPATVEQARAVLAERHRAEDFTLITQDAMLRSFRSIIQAITLALAAIAAVSLAVAGIGIMNVMLVSVSERVSEVGLLKALGGTPAQITWLFLAEALLLSGSGALAGILLGAAVLRGASGLWPAVDLSPSAVWVAVIFAFALVNGAVFGLMPARRASRLQAAEALRGKR